jgi:ribosomal protein L22
MTPDTPATPDQGKVPDESIAEDAKQATEAVAQTEAAPAKEKPKRARKPRTPKAEEAAPATEEEVEEKPKPARKPRARKPPAEEPKPAPAPRREPVAAPVVRAQAKYVRTSARKARLVCDHIRGKSVDEARAILLHTPRQVAQDWSKLLESAVANAEHNHELVGDDLKVLAAYADEGPTLKRFRPRAMGRATRIRKRTSHLTITLTPKETRS